MCICSFMKFIGFTKMFSNSIAWIKHMAASRLGNWYTLEIDSPPRNPDLYWIYLFKCCVFNSSRLRKLRRRRTVQDWTMLHWNVTSKIEFNLLFWPSIKHISNCVYVFFDISEYIYNTKKITFIVFANYIIFYISLLYLWTGYCFFISLIIMINFTWRLNTMNTEFFLSEMVKPSHREY